MLSVLSRGDPESAVALPPSDGSSGICTFRRGRFAPAPDMLLFVLAGGANSDTDDDEIVRVLLWAKLVFVFARGGGGGEGTAPFALDIAPRSTDCGRLAAVASEREASAVEVEFTQC